MRKSILVLFCLLAISSLHNDTQAQGFSAPSDSNAVVYFVKVTKAAEFAYFEIFHDSTLICLLRGANYLRYECQAGPQMFWASASNKQFLNCDLKPGGTYLVLVHPAAGNLGLNVVFETVTPDNSEFKRVVTFIKENYGFSTGRMKLKKTQDELNERGFIALNLDKYKRGYIRSPSTKLITPDMAIPESYLK